MIIKLSHFEWLVIIIGIKKDVVDDERDKRHNLSIYYKQNYKQVWR